MYYPLLLRLKLYSPNSLSRCRGTPFGGVPFLLSVLVIDKPEGAQTKLRRIARANACRLLRRQTTVLARHASRMPQAALDPLELRRPVHAAILLKDAWTVVHVLQGKLSFTYVLVHDA